MKKEELVKLGLSEEDAETLRSKYNLKTIFDLRNEGEVNARPDAEIPGVTNIACTVYGTKDEEGFDNPVYIRYLATGTAKAGYKKLFDAWLDTEEGAFLWHCKSGKDRTGLSGMMILAALGAVGCELFAQRRVICGQDLGGQERGVGGAAGAD